MVVVQLALITFKLYAKFVTMLKLHEYLERESTGRGHQMSRDESTALSTPLLNSNKPHDEGVGYDENTEFAKLEYETVGTSARKLAEKYSIPRNKLNKIIKSDKWLKYGSSQGDAKSNTAPTAPHAPILGTIAMRKIQEVREELGEHYSPVDEPLIVVFAKTYERYIELEKKLMNKGEEIVMTGAKGGSYLNPIFTALQAVQKTLLTYANQLGLSMTSRKLLGIKLNNGKKSEMSLFDIASDVNSMSVEI